MSSTSQCGASCSTTRMSSSALRCVSTSPDHKGLLFRGPFQSRPDRPALGWPVPSWPPAFLGPCPRPQRCRLRSRFRMRWSLSSEGLGPRPLSDMANARSIEGFPGCFLWSGARRRVATQRRPVGCVDTGRRKSELRGDGPRRHFCMSLHTAAPSFQWVPVMGVGPGRPEAGLCLALRDRLGASRIGFLAKALAGNTTRSPTSLLGELQAARAAPVLTETAAAACSPPPFEQARSEADVSASFRGAR